MKRFATKEQESLAITKEEAAELAAATAAETAAQEKDVSRDGAEDIARICGEPDED